MRAWTFAASVFDVFGDQTIVRNEQIRLAGLRRRRERTNTEENPC